MSEYLGNAFTDEQQTDPEAGISAFDLCIGMIVVCGCDNHSESWTSPYHCSGYHKGAGYPIPD